MTRTRLHVTRECGRSGEWNQFHLKGTPQRMQQRGITSQLP
ncbi:hypothetical protein OH687_22970 [Burkholderia anthina]|nr:hypothetical protein OH687_22970 [Burkholderia anthina]